MHSIPRRRKKKYNIGRLPPEDTREEEERKRQKLEFEKEEKRQLQSLSHWNAKIEDIWERRASGQPLPQPELPDELWYQWLWDTDPWEPYQTEVLLNRNQLLGLLLARYRGAMQRRFHANMTITLEDYLKVGYDEEDMPHSAIGKVCMYDIPVCSYSLRELRDTIQNIQVVWTEADMCCMPNVMEAVNACFHRFGVLASCVWKENIMNDQGSIEEFSAEHRLLKMNRISIRRFVCVFHTLYRHLHFHQAAVRVDGLKNICNPDIRVRYKKTH